jgi:glycosyltransferase involved in cell wall biosynthesis
MDPSPKIRLAYFVSHPIQYQAPLLRHIATQPDIELTVYFTTDFSVRGYLDSGFGVEVAWDVPLLDGYKYEFLPAGLFSNAHPNWQISPGIFGLLKRSRFDAVWLHGYHSFNALQALLACRLLRIPVLVRSESHLSSHGRSGLKLALKDAFFHVLRQGVAGALACGTANREYWRHYMGEDFPIFEMTYAVDNEFFQREARKASPSREQLRAELGLDTGRPVILFASKFQPRKRCLDLVEAFLRVAASPPGNRDPYLVFIGDGEDRPAVERLAARNPSIRLLGFRNQSELPRYYDLCDLFVLPSIHETWGLVVNEAMNAGRPVLISNQVGCQADLVHDGVNGFVFEALNIDSLTHALERALASPAELERMGKESLRIIDGCSFDRNLAGLREALRTVIPSGRMPLAHSKTTGAEESA